MGVGGLARVLFISLLAIISFSSFAHADVGNPPPNQIIPQWYDNIYLWVGLSVLISSAVIALAYMVSRLFGIQILEAWAKIEIAELMTSILIAVFCIGLIATVNGAAQFLVGESGATDVATIARVDFLQNELYANGKVIYTSLGAAYFNIAKIASYSYTAGTSIGVASISYSQTPAGGIFALASQVGQGMDTTANMMLLAAAQSAFLLFFKNAALVMLPVGIFLRSFSLTRKIGGVVLAGVIATSVVFPASYLVSRELYNTFSGEMMAGAAYIVPELPTLKNPPTTGLVCSPVMQRIVQGPIPFVGGETGWFLATCPIICLASLVGYGACLTSCRQVINTIFYILKAVFPIIAYAGFLLPFAGDLGSSGIVDDYFDPIYDYALPAVAKYAILSTIVFLIPLIITMTLLRNLAVAFGGEPQLYGLSKLV